MNDWVRPSNLFAEDIGPVVSSGFCKRLPPLTTNVKILQLIKFLNNNFHRDTAKRHINILTDILTTLLLIVHIQNKA